MEKAFPVDTVGRGDSSWIWMNAPVTSVGVRLRVAMKTRSLGWVKVGG